MADLTPFSYSKIYSLIDLTEDKEFSEKYCYQKENFVIQTEIEFELLKKQLLMVLSSSLTKALVMKEDPEKVRDELRIICNMIKYGVYK